MIEEKELIQRLNLLGMSKNFVLHENTSDGSADVITINEIPSNDGIYWVAGVTTLKNGNKLESVFRVNTDTGGTLLEVFWKINSTWYDQQNKQAVKALGEAKKEIFPYDWSYAVPLKEDIYHD